MSLITIFRSQFVPVGIHAGTIHDNLHSRKPFNSITYTPQTTVIASAVSKPSGAKEMKPSFGATTTQTHPVVQRQVVSPASLDHSVAIQLRTRKDFIGATKEPRTTEVTATAAKPISNTVIKPCSERTASKHHPPTHHQAISPICPDHSMTIQLRRPKHPLHITNVPQTSAVSSVKINSADADAEAIKPSFTNFLVKMYPTTQSPENAPIHPDGPMIIQLYTPKCYTRDTNAFPTTATCVNVPTPIGNMVIKPGSMNSTIQIHPAAQPQVMDSIGNNHPMAIKLRRPNHSLYIANISLAPDVSAAESKSVGTVTTKPSSANLIAKGHFITPSQGGTPAYPNGRMVIQLRTPRRYIRGSAVPQAATALEAPTRSANSFTIKLQATKTRGSGVKAQPHETADHVTRPAKRPVLDLPSANCLMPFSLVVENHAWLPRVLKLIHPYHRAVLRVIGRALPAVTAIISAAFV
ncbi:hypothetical protein H4R33_005760 [Dimargaris cristalligena]|uniref:Uncharacterized protein n=1 Tax=Dimargaris cristalligena TaxID=215637 RepID=A0A4P9ZR60_9FUNG|nr:hypothetical protein H4R33_005760 [Dimargaris cristalligena]RKP35923.1 hypothetical protein BJ085DRAFT_27999 [Dimargaris cristalligena]|eukprot:RKP35923.1 hypothetical protein BJ085DRAFT_27999 [Dimargaris cristalligena]